MALYLGLKPNSQKAGERMHCSFREMWVLPGKFTHEFLRNCIFGPAMCVSGWRVVTHPYRLGNRDGCSIRI